MATKKGGYLFKRGDTYYLQYDVNGRRKVKSLKTTNERDAKKKKDEILEAVYGINDIEDVVRTTAKAKKIYQPKDFPLDILSMKYEKTLQRKNASSDSVSRYKLRIKRFTGWCNQKYSKSMMLSEITDDIAQNYADDLSESDIANKTYNDTINALQRAIEQFREDASLVKNPFRKENIERRDIEYVNREDLSEEQTLTLLESLKTINLPDKEEFEILFHIGTWSGLRLKDACLLKWKDISFSRNMMYLTPFKTRKHGTKVKIPIHPLLKKMLIIAQDWKSNEYVLPTLADVYRRRRDIISRDVQKIFKLNGYNTTQENTTNRKRAACLYGFHSLRYTFVSACAKAGVPATLVMDIVGHKNAAMTKYYTRFDDKYQQDAIGSLSLGSNDISTMDKISQNLSNLEEKQLEEVLAYIEKLKKRGITS